MARAPDLTSKFSSRFVTLCSLYAAGMLIALISTLLPIAIVSIVPGGIYIAALFVVGAVLAHFYPAAAISLLITALPLFGNRPGSGQTWCLLLIASSLGAGLIPQNLSALHSTAAKRQGQSLPLFFLAVFFTTSVVSLIGFPLGDLLRAVYSQRVAWSDYEALSLIFLGILDSREESIFYPLLAVYWTAIGLNLSFAVSRIITVRPAKAELFCLSIFIGLALSLLAGLLDYYDFIDLRSIRALDPVVNPGDVQFRLQSFFGHSGWFAEYVTLCIPFAMIVLLLPLKFWTRISILLAFLLVGEFALILTFQRGGWLSYPLTLLAVWAAVYVSRRLELGDLSVIGALRRSAIKILISFPITVAFSLGLLFWMSKCNLLPSGVDFSMQRYTQRFADITRTGDRSEFVRAAYLLGLEQPFGGWGSESFAYAYRREFREPSGTYSGLIDLPLHGSAHNVYAQVFAGRGVLGLAALLALLSSLVFSCSILAVRGEQRSLRERLVLLMCATSGVAFVVYGFVQEIFYVQALTLLFSAIVGIAAGTSFGAAATSRFLSVITISLLVLLSCAHLVWNAIYPGTTYDNLAKPQPFGCYGSHSETEDLWCGPRALRVFKVACREGVPVLPLRVTTAIFRKDQPAYSLQFYYGDAQLHEIALKPQTTETAAIALNDFGFTCPADEQSQINVFMTTAAYFVPALDMEDSRDKRILSYRVGQ